MLKLVIFDCDGVLVDSEGLSHLVVMDEAANLGIPIDKATAASFVGRRWSDLQPIFEAELGHGLGGEWPLHMQNNLIALMKFGISAIPGAAEALRATTGLGLPYRIASNSSREEMAAKFAAVGLTDLVGDRIHSAKDVGIGKPAPDLFLATAAAEGVLPAECLVIEDSLPGVTAALAAGMRCIAYTPHGDPFGLAALGATPITSLAELPALLRALHKEHAA
jgi:beta-phosphoglucomutase-like phosphatase (HAD superfamily)